MNHQVCYGGIYHILYDIGRIVYDLHSRHVEQLHRLSSWLALYAPLPSLRNDSVCCGEPYALTTGLSVQYYYNHAIYVPVTSIHSQAAQGCAYLMHSSTSLPNHLHSAGLPNRPTPHAISPPGSLARGAVRMKHLRMQLAAAAAHKQWHVRSSRRRTSQTSCVTLPGRPSMAIGSVYMLAPPGRKKPALPLESTLTCRGTVTDMQTVIKQPVAL